MIFTPRLGCFEPLAAKSVHDRDLKNSLGTDNPAKTLAQKYSRTNEAFHGQFLFPSPSLTVDLLSGQRRRWHTNEPALQRALLRAGREAGIAKEVNARVLRHSFTTHMLAAGADIRTVQEILGNSGLTTAPVYGPAAKTGEARVSQAGLLPTPKRCTRLAWLNRMLRSGISLDEIKERRWSRGGGDYSIYCLAEDGQRVRYVGITNQAPESRLRQHLADCGRGKNIYKENWLRACVKRGIPITIHVVRSGLTAERACMMEFELIRFFKKPLSLVNTHAGGATGYAGLSEESKEKHRINTEKGLLASAQRELEAKDMERGYCVLEEWGWSHEQGQPAPPAYP